MNDGGPAFPVECSFDKGAIYGGLQTGNSSGWVTGVSIRDYFAAQAMTGLLHIGADPMATPRVMAEWSYKFADAMLAARAVSAIAAEGE